MSVHGCQWNVLNLHDETIGDDMDVSSNNASAEAFNSKVKIFRAQMRGVRDRDFFIFRLVKLYA
jgi:transposase